MPVLTRAELIAHLGGLRAYRRALRDGSWKRVLRGTYVTGGTEINLAVRSAAVQRVLPEHTVVADRCLLWLLGVDVLPPGEVFPECVVPRLAVVPRRTGVRTREAALPEGDVGVLEGSQLRALRPARAVADLLRRLDLLEAGVVADAVLRERLCSLTELQAELVSHARLRGVVQARRVLTLADARAESPPESRLRLLLVLAGLAPVPQYEIRTAAGWYRVDLAFPELRIAVEYDGREVHDRADVFTSDRRRQNALVAEGWVVLRFTAADLRKAGREQVVAAVQAAVLAQARRTA